MRTYCFHSFLSISHSNHNHNKDDYHIHTIELSIFIKLKKTASDIQLFSDIENLIKDSLVPYNQCCLNEMKEFEKDVSIEHLGEILFALLDTKMKQSDIYMEKLEIGETPLRTYIITKKI